MSIIFISCSNSVTTNEDTNTKQDNVITNEDSDTSQDNAITTNTTDIHKDTDTSNQNSNNNISKIYFDYNGFKLDLNLTDEMIAELSEFENNSTVPDTELDEVFATIYAVYEDNSEKIFGGIYIGDDGAFYIKCESNPNKDAAYKLADNFLDVNNIF